MGQYERVQNEGIRGRILKRHEKMLLRNLMIFYFHGHCAIHKKLNNCVIFLTGQCWTSTV